MLVFGSKEKPTYVPMEVCVISPGQRCLKKLNEDQTANMVKVRKQLFMIFVFDSHYCTITERRDAKFFFSDLHRAGFPIRKIKVNQYPSASRID